MGSQKEEKLKENWQDSKFVDWYNRNLRFDTEQIDAYVAPLCLCAQDDFIDFGCGNGVLLERVAPQVRKAAGIDGSDEQLRQARERLASHTNIELIKSELFSCDLGDRCFSKASARKSLHHLTDEEKPVFLRRLAANFAEGAIFVLEDGIFDFDKGSPQENLDRVLAEAESHYGQRWEMIREPFSRTIIEEFPTDLKTWKEAFRQGGFQTFKYERITSFYGKLVASKQ
jgi:ubiquinone/menaquinone biosynthesis C-methylase UbiE